MTTKSETKKPELVSVTNVVNNSYYKNQVSIRIKAPYGYVMVDALIEMHGLSTGCGIGTMSGWAAYFIYINNDETTKFLIEEIKKAAGTRWYCLIATLGQVYLGTKESPSVHEKWLEQRGFKECFDYINKVHSPTYHQKVYMVEIKDLK